jgi:hypothetical protein
MQFFMYQGAIRLVRQWLEGLFRDRPATRDFIRDGAGSDNFKPVLKQQILDDARRIYPSADESDRFALGIIEDSVRALTSESLRDIVDGLLADEPVSVPERAPQQTYQEARNTAMAIGHAPATPNLAVRYGDLQQGRWEPIKGEAALRFIVTKDERLEVKFVAPPRDYPQPSYDGLFDELRKRRPVAVMLFQLVIGLAIEIPGHVRVSLDHLIETLGWTVRNSGDRNAKRRMLLDWLRIFERLWVVGQRGGKYRDPDTRLMDLTINEAFIRLTGLGTVTDSEGEQQPVEVFFVAGPWLDRFRYNRKVLSSLRRLAEDSPHPIRETKRVLGTEYCVGAEPTVACGCSAGQGWPCWRDAPDHSAVC